MRVEYRDLRVFARDGEGGNPLAVADAATVPESIWQATATAVGYSETVFVETETPARAHIFTPARRIPFAGHPLVGTAATLPAHHHHLRYDVGVAEIEHGEDATWVTVDGERPVRAIDAPGIPGAIAAALVEVPLTYLVVQLDSVARLESFLPEAAECMGEVYLWVWSEAGRAMRARFFAPDLAVPEDPATGSAAVALARVAAEVGLGEGPQESGSLRIDQGSEMGRPCTILLAWDGQEVSIGGSVLDEGLGSVEVS